MKNMFLNPILITVCTLVSTIAMAQATFEGCQTQQGIIPFSNYHQEGANYVANAQLSTSAFVKYNDVYNMTTLSFIVDNKVVASSTGLHIMINFHGQRVYCQVSR